MDKRIEFDQLIYSINIEEKTAGIIGFNTDVDELIIPRSINHDSVEYIVTSILRQAFRCSQSRSIQFAENSEIRTIEKEAFIYSFIKNITIPSSLIELKKGWCKYTTKLTSINVSPNNPRYKAYENKFLIGKSSNEIDNFDALVFCSRDAESITIPSFIKRIGSFAFHNCQKLHTIEIPSNCELTTIEKKALMLTKIENFTIPSSLIYLEDGWCCQTSKLIKIHVSPNNPRYCCLNENLIIGKSSIESENYDVLVFCSRNIEKVTIPSFIKCISPYSFENCHQIQRIEIPIDSELQTIEKYGFSSSSIQSIEIPNHLKIIKKFSFCNCSYLQEIKFSEKCEIKTIEKEALCWTKIECFTIPSNLVDLKDGWCSWTEKIKKIIVSPNNPIYKKYEDIFLIGKSSIESENYDLLSFCVRNVKKVTIPSFIKQIESFAFNKCEQLQIIEFQKDSQLQTIKNNAFSSTSIEKIKIPIHLTEIGEFAFNFCSRLRIIDIPANSELKKISKEAFSHSSIISLIIPPHVTKIGEFAFYLCQKLQIIEIDENSEIKILDQSIFCKCKKTIIMIPVKLNISFRLSL